MYGNTTIYVYINIYDSRSNCSGGGKQGGKKKNKNVLNTNTVFRKREGNDNTDNVKNGFWAMGHWKQKTEKAKAPEYKVKNFPQ